LAYKIYDFLIYQPIAVHFQTILFPTLLTVCSTFIDYYNEKPRGKLTQRHFPPSSGTHSPVAILGTLPLQTKPRFTTEQ